MIELIQDQLVFSFPQVWPDARLTVSFQRTLRIPDDGRTYPLPPGLGRFPLRHVDDHHDRLPASWVEHGGVMTPMYQSEALWLSFQSDYLGDRGTSYPFAVKIAAGKIDAVTGQDYAPGLGSRPQDYLVVPTQPWLDGYAVEKGLIRQFVAMPLGAGYTAEEQLTGRAEHGGLQIHVYPMKRQVFERRFPKREASAARFAMDEGELGMAPCAAPAPGMGLAPGGRMKQEIYEDPYGLSDWDQTDSSRCFVHLANSLVWRGITGENPPTVPFTAQEYTRHGFPWFDYYDDQAKALDGSKILKGLKSVVELAKEKGDAPLPENQPVDPKNVVKLRANLGKDQVREGKF